MLCSSQLPLNAARLGVSRTAGSHERWLYSQAIEYDTRFYLPGGNVGVTELDTTTEDGLGDITEGTTTVNKLDVIALEESEGDVTTLESPEGFSVGGLWHITSTSFP